MNIFGSIAFFALVAFCLYVAQWDTERKETFSDRCEAAGGVTLTARYNPAFCFRPEALIVLENPK